MYRSLMKFLCAKSTRTYNAKQILIKVENGLQENGKYHGRVNSTTTKHLIIFNRQEISSTLFSMCMFQLFFVAKLSVLVRTQSYTIVYAVQASVWKISEVLYTKYSFIKEALL
jgi:hypothetical protein